MPLQQKDNKERSDSLAILKKRSNKVTEPAVAVTQTGNNNHPFKLLSAYSPYNTVDYELYRSLREAVPVIDASIGKLVRLLGDFKVSCETEEAESKLSDFLENVNVGGTRKGIYSFISTFFDQLLTYGTAIGEMALTNEEITHLYNADLRSVSLSQGESPLDIIVSARTQTGQFVPVRYPSLILKCVHNPEPGKIYGTSILKGLPFVSEILMKIFNTIGINWERVGNVRFAVTYKPQNDALDKAYAKERAIQVANEWSKAMSGGAVRDFVAVGDVQIKAIGADNQIPDSEVPVRQILEQIIAKLGIPPFLLGLSWSSTERMSAQQADILTSEIDYYRREITPVIKQICDSFLRFSGYSEKIEIKWNDLTLQDITELAKSALYEAQSEKIRRETGVEENNE